MKNRRPEILSLNGFLAFQILHELRKEKLCGDDLAVIIGERKGSKLTPGTIYPALKFLRKKKLVKHRKFGRKKIYTITEFGEQEYDIMHENFTEIFKGVIKKSKK
tara:strand:+ start:408 stop:722 length:315 start_codon:yes stop_codon:yes gene_type:complete